MLYFNCDYSEGAHEKIMARMMQTNMEQTIGYGEDYHCTHARELIRSACEAPDADVHFLVGGTQANLTVIASALRPHQAVIGATTAHINVHETGAIEATGHKVLALSSVDGKLTAAQVEECYLRHSDEHMVQPKMVYISDSTEVGTVYKKTELEALSAVCHKLGLYLFLDGARLGYALAAADNDVTLQDIARLCDVFYIGGTKVGALFGEAVVIMNPSLKPDFRYYIKQKGGMLAKGRLLGIQFETLFENDLYMEISAHADRMADRLRLAFAEAGYSFCWENQSNQIFVVMPDEKLEKLKESYVFNYDHRADETHSVVRVCTSWATKEEAVERLIRDL